MINVSYYLFAKCVRVYSLSLSSQLNEKMSTIKPFIFGGLASLTAEFGESQ